MLRFARAPRCGVEPCALVARIRASCFCHVEPNTARRTPQLIFERFVTLLDARHQRNQRLDQFKTQLFELKCHRETPPGSVSPACEPHPAPPAVPAAAVGAASAASTGAAGSASTAARTLIRSPPPEQAADSRRRHSDQIRKRWAPTATGGIACGGNRAEATLAITTLPKGPTSPERARPPLPAKPAHLSRAKLAHLSPAKPAHLSPSEARSRAKLAHLSPAKPAHLSRAKLAHPFPGEAGPPLPSEARSRAKLAHLSPAKPAHPLARPTANH
jgi:hypothetical protein